MKLEVDFSPDLVALLEQEIKAGERAVTATMKSAGAGLKQDWREQITRAGLGHHLPRTIRNRTYPTSGESINAAALVWSNAPEILNAHDRGALIRSKTGRGQISAPIFLLVPQVKLRKRLDLARDAEKVAGAVPGLVVEKWVAGQ